MDKMANDFKDKSIVMYHLYTSSSSRLPDFSWSKRPVLVDRNGSEGIRSTLCGGDSKSLVVIDKEGKLALFQRSPNPEKLRKKLEEMTSLEQEY